MLIPIPPILEQKRIVSSIEKWFDIVDNVENSLLDLQAAIKQAKSKILDLAIHGKLVPQDPNDEPASELLHRINPKAAPMCDIGQYGKLPKGWCFCRLEYLIDIISGTSYDKCDIISSANGIKVIRGGNIQNGRIKEFDDDIYLDYKYHNKTNTIKQNDIVIVASTGSSILIGKTAFAKKNYTNTQIGAFLRILRSTAYINASYINIIVSSDYFRDYIRSLAKGTNINNIKNKYLADFKVPLPPISEQNYIVDRVEELCSSLEEIELSLQ